MIPGMEWLNDHHLRYSWTVAKEGSFLNRPATNCSPNLQARLAEAKQWRHELNVLAALRLFPPRAPDASRFLPAMLWCRAVRPALS
jgi:hypothetical protein